MRTTVALLAASALLGLTTAPAHAGKTPAPSQASVQVTPTTFALATVGQTRQLTVVVKDKAGKVVAKPTVAWKSSNTAIARVTSTGLVTAVAKGTAVVTATSSGLSAASTVVVGNASPTVTIAAPIDVSTAFRAGDTIKFAATASDAESGDRTPSLRWRYYDAADAARANPQDLGSFSAFESKLPAGSWVVQAYADDPQGARGVAEIPVTVLAGTCSFSLDVTPAYVDDGYGTPATLWAAQGSIVPVSVSVDRNTCTRPLVVRWTCTAWTGGQPTDPCTDFLAQANAQLSVVAPGASATAAVDFRLPMFDMSAQISVGLTPLGVAGGSVGTYRGFATLEP